MKKTVLLLVGLALGLGLLGLFLRRHVPFRRSDQQIIGMLVPSLATGRSVGGLNVKYPRAGTIFPPEFPSPTLQWEDDTGKADTWLIAVELAGEPQAIAALSVRREWRPEPEQWLAIKRASVDADARISVLGFCRARPGNVLSGGSVYLRTSTDEVGAPIFYRDVPLPFLYAVANPDTIRWRFGTVSSEETPPVVLEGLPVCGNCHSFSGDGSVLGMDVDYANDKGSYGITTVTRQTALSADKVITWSDYRREDGQLTFGLLSQVSPDGRYVVSTVKDRSVFVPRDDLAYSQLFFPMKGILVVYDRETEEFSALPGADDPAYVQTNASWSPDGKYLVFARSRAERIEGAEKLKGILLPGNLVKEFLEGTRGFRYDLYRIPFNGGEGGEAVPIRGASNNGMSNYFPRLSPDGKWMVFCKAKNFMLLQPDSKLFILPSQGGTPREMTANTAEMNSWHSWSPNGRWLVFSSKQGGPYTRLFLTHVDEDGRDSPPVLLENFVDPGRAANIPEFVNLPEDGLERITESFIDDTYLERQGNSLVQRGTDYAAAIKAYRRALELNPRNAGARTNLAVAASAMGNGDEAERELKEVLKHAPAYPGALKNLAILYMTTRRFGEAAKTYQALREVQPGDPRTLLDLGMAHLQAGEFPQAEAVFRSAVILDPGQSTAHVRLGCAVELQGRKVDAIQHYRDALSYDSERIDGCLLSAERLMGNVDVREDILKLARDVLADRPDCTRAHVIEGEAHHRQGDTEAALRAFENALKAGDGPPWLAAKIAEIKRRSTHE